MEEARISSDIALLSKELNDSAGKLSAYQIKQITLRLKELEQKLISVRRPPKFSFKRPEAQKNLLPTTTVTQVLNPPPNSDPDTPSLANISNTYISSKDLPDSVHSLLNISNSVIDLSAPISALHVRNLTNCVLLCTNIAGSLILHDIFNCVVLVSCHQFRMHSSTSTDIYISSPSQPIIEACSTLRFASYPEFLGEANSTSPLSTVIDFSHINTDSPSPHWSFLDHHLQISGETWNSFISPTSTSVDRLPNLLPEQPATMTS